MHVCTVLFIHFSLLYKVAIVNFFLINASNASLSLRRLLWVNQLGQLSLLPSVGRGMNSISVARRTKLSAAVSPSSECLYEEKADVVYLQATLCDPHLGA